LDGEFKKFVGGRWYCAECAAKLERAAAAADGGKAKGKVRLRQVRLEEVEPGAPKPPDVPRNVSKEKRGLRGR